MKSNMIHKRPVCALAVSCFDAWIHNIRTIIMLIVLIITACITVHNYGEELKHSEISMHMDESIVWLLLNGFNSISLSSLVFLVSISEIPRKISFMQYCAFRTSKTKYTFSIMCYCFLMVFMVIIMLTCFSAFFLLRYVSPGSGWSDALRIRNGMPEELAVIPAWMRNNYAPWQGALLAAGPIIGFWLVMVLTILFFNILNHPMVGVSIFAMILFSGLIFVFENFPALQAPMAYSTLNRIVLNYEDQFSSRITSVFIGYAVVIICQAGVIFGVSRKRENHTCSSSNI